MRDLEVKQIVMYNQLSEESVTACRNSVGRRSAGRPRIRFKDGFEIGIGNMLFPGSVGEEEQSSLVLLLNC